MGKAAEYQTRQRRAILDYLNRSRGRYITAGEAAAYFREAGEEVSLTTVYRQLERMAVEGIVRKQHIEGIRGVCFCAADQAGGAAADSLTMKCEDCGRIVRIACPDLGHLYEHFAKDHGISVDPQKTVFYGRCDRCGAKAGGGK